MKQAQISFNRCSQKANINANYQSDDIFEEFYKAGRAKRIYETLSAYEYINRKQGVTREQLLT